jgi:SulP family sulfate permease
LAALLGLPGVLACALVVAGPLDDALFPMAVQSALVSVLCASLLGCWLSGIRGQISGPRIALSLLITADLATVPNPTPAALLMLIGALTALTGVTQIGMGLSRLGSMVRYLPFPLLAGFSRQSTFPCCGRKGRYCSMASRRVIPRAAICLSRCRR